MPMVPVGRDPGSPRAGARTSGPLLSVTVTNFNYGRFLDQNLSSIRNQTFDDLEVIVVDNASTDNSLEVIERHASEDPRIRVVAHSENLGMFASLRESVDLCTGTYRVHVDADDFILVPDAFEAQVRSLEANPTMAFTYGRLVMVDTSDAEVFVARAFPHDVVLPGPVALETVLAFTLNHSGMMFRLDAYRATAGYPDRYAHVADMLLAGRLCATGDVGYIDRPLYAFRKHGGNLHLRPELHVVRDEMIPVIQASYAGLPAGSADPAAERRAVRRALVHLPTQYVFSGQHKIGWRLFWESAKVRPVDTVFQRRTLSLVGRTMLGPRAFDAVATRVNSTLRSLPSRSGEHVPAADAGGAGGSREETTMEVLGLHRGEVVEVRSPAEILATLDDRGCLNNLPFMPEMISRCGRLFTVDRRADKVCDTIETLRSRRINDAVLLEGERCDGSGHAGCQADCKFYWHEAWLRRAGSGPTTQPDPDAEARLRELIFASASYHDEDGAIRYRCQATEMVRASDDLSTLAPGPYLNEYRTHDVSLGTFVKVMTRAAVVQPLHKLNLLPIVPVKGPSPKSPETEPLGLQPGEWVRVKSRDEIAKTLTDKGRNRGLWFDREMLPFCGGTYRVRRRITRIIEEHSGKLLELTRDCVTLEGVVCSGERSTSRWFCPREIPCYWRECWLERVPAPALD